MRFVLSLIYLACVGAAVTWIGLRLQRGPTPRSLLVAWVASAMIAATVALVPWAPWRSIAGLASEPMFSRGLLLGAAVVYLPVTGAAMLVTRRALRAGRMQFTAVLAVQAMLASVAAFLGAIVLIASASAASSYFLGT